MNDIVLSSLIHLFVLFGAKNNIDLEKSKELISSYLTRFFGIRNIKSYIRLYEDLRGFYDGSVEIDKEAVVDSICANLTNRISKEEKISLLLRLLEFCSQETDRLNPDDEIFSNVRSAFEISESEYADMVAFIRSEKTDNVLVFPPAENCGILKTIRIPGAKFLAVSYVGQNSIWMDDIKMMSGVFQIWQQSSLVKSNHFAPIYHSTIMRMYSGEVGETVEFAGRDINYLYKNSKVNGMHNLSFTLHDGELVAIMGGSGVGKSTLLGLLNGTMVADSGKITINGHDISEPQARKMIGYVPQDDLLFEELTVFENLWYTAKLCFDKMPDDELREKVNNTLKDLGLSEVGYLKVGSPVNKFISGGQRKRLNIALELIREPSILFLDEPTSGLSSTDTEKVIMLLKELTGKGKLIITNIHQPSSNVFKLFDRLWILDKGGFPIYDGNPIEAISYFKTAANYADSRSSACPTCGNVNPEIMLNIIDEKQFDNSGKLTDKRKTSVEEWHEMYLAKRGTMAEPKKADIPHSDQKKPGRLRQILIFFERNLKAKLSNIQYIAVTLLEAPILATICSLLTRYKAGDVYTLSENINFPSYIFMAIIVSIFLGMSGSAEEIIKDKAILKREKFLQLSYSSYIWSKILYMGVVCLIQSLMFVLVGNSIIGIQGGFFLWLGILFLASFLSALIGLLLSKTMSSVVAIYITIPLLLIPQILLCGLVVKFDDLVPNSKTGYVPVVADVIPSRWAYEALAVGSYSMNRYESMLFDNDRERYEAMNCSITYIPALTAANEQLHDPYGLTKEEKEQNKALLSAQMEYVSVLSGVKAPSGKWNYYKTDDFLTDATVALKGISNKASMKNARILDKYARDNGKDNLKELKSRCCNERLETLVTGVDKKNAYRVSGARIIPLRAQVFLCSDSRIGRSAFYTGTKRIGNSTLQTYWYDLFVLIFFCIVLGAVLFIEKKD